MKIIKDKKYDQLVSRIAELKKTLSERENDLKMHKLEMIRKQGLEIGVVVIDTDGEEFKVCGIDLSDCYNGLWVKGYPRKKNGDFGKAIRNLFDG